MNYTLCIGVSAAISGVAAISTATFTYFKNINDSKVSRERNEQIISLQQQVIDKQAQLNEKTQELNNEITGGNNLCILKISIMRSLNHLDSRNPIIWSEMIGAINEGEYIIRDIFVHLEKPNLNWKHKGIHGSMHRNDMLENDFDIPYLLGKDNGMRQGKQLIWRDIPNDLIQDNKITYSASITTRKGTYSQISKFALSKNYVWHQATIVHDAKMNVVYEHISPDYPKGEDGKVDWTVIE